MEDRVQSGLLRKDDDAEKESKQEEKVTIGMLKEKWGLFDSQFKASA